MQSSELDALREVLTGCIDVQSDDLLQFTIINTPFRRITAKLIFPGDYPRTTVALELASPALKPAQLKNIETACIDAANRERGGKQALAIAEYLKQLVFTDRLLYCRPEVRKFERAAGAGVEVRCKEEEGEIKVLMQHGEYKAGVVLVVPDNYPVEPPSVDIPKSNIPPSMVRKHLRQAVDIAVRCSQGRTGEQALSESRAAAAGDAPRMGGAALPEVRLTTDHLLNLKHDVRFLKKTSDLRQLNATRRDGDHRQFAHSTDERRQARRTLRRLTKEEEEAEAKQAEEMARVLEAERRAEAEGAPEAEADVTRRVTEYARLAESGAQGSVYPVLAFLFGEFVRRLPEEKCQACKRRILPKAPARAREVLGSDDPAVRPVSVYCGHWFHYSCLEKFILEPPFQKPCPVCGRVVTHRDWPSDVRQLERRWAMAQARKREMAEAADFLCLDSEFQRQEVQEEGFDDSAAAAYTVE